MTEDFVASGWRDLLMNGRMAPGVMHPAARGFAQVFKRLPGTLRCRLCHAPFDGAGGKVAAGLFGVHPSTFSMQLCGRCEGRARGEKTGATVEIATLFADIRGSTPLAAEVGPQRFRDLIDRFYTAATDVLIREEAIIEKLVGDQVAAIFVPGLAGADYVQRAVDSAVALQQAFGVGSDSGAWVPVGIGIDAGEAFVGVVGTMGGMTELTVLGDVPNRTARLASAAAAGETLVTQTALDNTTDTPIAETRTIRAKGISQPVTVGILGSPD